MASQFWEDDELCIPATTRSVILAAIFVGSVSTTNMAYLPGANITIRMILVMESNIVMGLNAAFTRTSQLCLISRCWEEKLETDED